MDNTLKKEIDEAIAAINTTLSHLKKAQKYLDSAGNWGAFDMIGGGFITNIIKHQKINEAQRSLSMTRDSIKTLKKELSDIDQIIEVDIELGDFLIFADYFFDGIVVDWMVQSKIINGLSQVNQAIEKLKRIKNNLLSIDC